MSEVAEAEALAEKVLNRVSADPDDDLALLARQFLRSREREVAASHERDKLHQVQKPLFDTLRDTTETLQMVAAERDAMNEALALILPLAKEYAAANPVGSHAEYIRQAEAALASGRNLWAKTQFGGRNNGTSSAAKTRTTPGARKAMRHARRCLYNPV